MTPLHCVRNVVAPVYVFILLSSQSFHNELLRMAVAAVLLSMTARLLLVVG